jgi:hypothetical protein
VKAGIKSWIVLHATISANLVVRDRIWAGFPTKAQAKQYAKAAKHVVYGPFKIKVGEK